MKKLVLITGATSGIGEACAIKYAENNCRIIICGRRRERLEYLQKRLVQDYKAEVYILNFDVRKRPEVQTAISNLPQNWKDIDVLINNAGLSLGLDNFQNASMEDWETMIDTNIKGLLYVTKEIVPYMIKNQKGHIINIGSIAGKEVYPKGNAYCATKFAVDALTKAMRVDMVSQGIKVSQIAPGAVETEFSLIRFKGDQEKADDVYKGYKPLTGEDIAETVYFVSSLPPHVNINDMLVMPVAQASSSVWHKK
ncbi:MAG: SDR family oxidoreductase [Hyphomicrobiales bacterium]